MKRKSMSKLVKIVTAAMLSALSFVLYLWEFPLIASAPHLKLDFSDIPALAGGLVLGTPYAVIIELVKNLLELIIRGFGSQMGFGNIMNFIVGCAFTVPFCIFYKKLTKDGKLKKPLAITVSDIASLIIIVVTGIGANYVIDPPFFKYFMGVTLTSETLWPSIWSATALNAIKGCMLTVVSYPLVLALTDRLKKALKI